MELERPTDCVPALATLAARYSWLWLLLLKDRHSELTLDSFSDLLFSLDKFPKPNRRLREELELIEPL